MILTPFFRVASIVIQWNWKYFTIILACLQLLQKPRYQSRHCCNSRTIALANITFFVLLNNTQYSRFSFKTGNFIYKYLHSSEVAHSIQCTQFLSLSTLMFKCAQFSVLSLVRSDQCNQLSALSLMRSALCAQLSALSLMRSLVRSAKCILSLVRSINKTFLFVRKIKTNL